MNEIVLDNKKVLQPDQVESIAQAIVNPVFKGEADKLVTWGNIVQLEKALKAAKNAIREQVEKELEQNTEKIFSWKGANFMLQSKAEYLYDGIEKYDKQAKKVEDEKKKLKRIEQELKDKKMYGIEYSKVVTVTFK
jgi:uncharacterized protein YlxW (UPF0749 family)